nr:PREDICTED: uncharacterized protein LOC105679233 [Linepithema humile]
MEWPSQSPDLNIIEPLWEELQRRLANKRATNTAEKFAQLEKEWKKIPQSTINTLIDSMPRRCQAVIDAKDNYKKALQKARKAEEFSDLNSQSENDNLTLPKRKMQKKYKNSDENSDEENILPSPPRIQNALKTVTKNTEPVTKTMVENNTITIPSKITHCQSSANNPNESSINANNNDIIVLNVPSCLECTCCPVHKGIIFNERALVNRNINENAYITMHTIFQFPLKTVEQVEGELDAYLKDAENFKSVVNEMKKIGGNSVYFVKRVLQVHISNELGSQYSWLGLKKKRVFKNFRFTDAIINSTQEIMQGSSKKDIEEAIKKWLRRCKERMANENKRPAALQLENFVDNEQSE